MATVCLDAPVEAFRRLECDYIHQHYVLQPGQKRPTAAVVSKQFGRSLKSFYGDRVHEALRHPSYLDYAIYLIADGAYKKRAAGQNGSQMWSNEPAGSGLVLYPNFQKAVVPGWLDKSLKWRHKATSFLDSMVLLAPDPQWVKKAA